jgi:hypothetical protein
MLLITLRRVWRLQQAAVIEAGGYTRNCVGEDMGSS